MTAANRGGAGKCATCAHEQIVAIDADLVAEVPQRQIVKRYGISARSLRRHRDAHLGREVVALPVHLTEATAGMSALARVETVYAGLMARWDVAQAGDQVGLVLAIAKELRASIELLARLSGELDEKPQNLTVNLLGNDQFMEFIKWQNEVLDNYPEAKRAVVEGLRVLNGGK